MQSSNELCKALETEPDFPPEISVRFRRYRKQLSITTCFETLSNFKLSFGFLNKFIDMEPEEIKKSCSHLHNKFKDGKSCDISGVEFYGVIFFKNYDKRQKAAQRTHKVFVQIQLENSFPNVATSLKLLQTVPVSFAPGERSFSKLKIIKNHLRTSMTSQ